MTITQAEIDGFHDVGYFTTEVLFDASTLDELKVEFHRLWSAEIEAAQAGNSSKLELLRLRPFLAHLHLQSEICARFCRHAAFADITSALLGPDIDLYYNQAVLKPAGKGLNFAWHQDSRYTVTRPLEYVTCWVAVGPATIENGTIWIVPGMHRQGILPHEWSEERSEWQCRFDETSKIPIELEAGQMAVFSSLLPHASGPNTSRETRYAYVPQYHVANVVRQDNGEPQGDRFSVVRDGVAVSPH